MEEITTTEMHTGGEPVRIIENGFPQLTSPTLLGKRREVLQKHDKIRSYLMSEPRGHAAMYGVILCDRELEEADLTVLFTHNEGLSTMCGHAVIALGRYAIEKGIVERSKDPAGTIVNVHCPCGLVKARVSPTNETTFTSVPSFVVATDVEIKLQNGKFVRVDVSFGGAFYAILDCTQLNIDVSSESISNLIDLGDEVKKLVRSIVKLSHPESADICFLYGVILTDGVEGCEDSKNFVIFADRQVDRSPCGSGTTARLALEYHKKKIGLNQPKRVLNSKVEQTSFSACVVEETELMLPDNNEPTKAVRVEVTGKGYYTGSCKFTLEPDDVISQNGGFLIA